MGGGVYLETLLGNGGLPVEAFLIEDPIKADLNALGASSLGVSMLKTKDGAWNVLDWIGEQHYPNVADFVEEVRAMGLSRRISRNLDFSKLTPASRVLTVHRKAFVENWRTFYDDDNPMLQPKETPASERFEKWRCPKGRHGHEKGVCHEDGCCIGAWWHDIVGGQPIIEGSRRVERTCGSTVYQAISPEHSGTYSAAIFAAFPISRIAVIRDPEGSHAVAMDKASRAHVPLSLEAE
jgi:hypothetical protein